MTGEPGDRALAELDPAVVVGATLEGEGPGEIAGWAADLTFGPDGRLHVRDRANRATV